MRIAVIGSRGIEVQNLESYLPPNVTELISGGAKGIDQCVRRYAETAGIPFVEFLPRYSRYGRGAPFKRNEEIVLRAECVIALWDGASKGTKNTIRLCKTMGKPVTVFVVRADGTVSKSACSII